MADLNIPNLNIKPDKYIFKKKLNLRRKSKRRLFTESFFLFILSVLLVYINYLIPNKNLLLKNLPSTFNKSFLLLIDLFSYLYEIFLVIFIFISSFTALFLMIRRPPRSTLDRSSAASDVYKRQLLDFLLKFNFFLKIYLSDLIFKFGMFKSALNQSSKKKFE